MLNSLVLREGKKAHTHTQTNSPRRTCGENVEIDICVFLLVEDGIVLDIMKHFPIQFEKNTRHILRPTYIHIYLYTALKLATLSCQWQFGCSAV